MAEEFTHAALEKWLAGYKHAWEHRDASAAALLFTENAAYHEMPFDTPKNGRSGIRDYWSSVTADQRNVAFVSRIIAVTGRVGVAHWSAGFTVASSGARLQLDGVFVLTFDDDGLCSELREWWHLKADA